MTAIRIIGALLSLLGASMAPAPSKVVSDAPEVRGRFTLTAAFDEAEKHNAFFFGDNTVPPTMRVLPGGALRVQYVNSLPVQSTERCALAQCANHTNLHFHGLHVSPDPPQDDVLTMLALSGDTLNYRVDVPSYSAPGLYWYHTHPHGESAKQALDGMTGAIVIDGIDRYYPDVRPMRERVLVLRDYDIENAQPEVRHNLLQQVGVPNVRCGTASAEQGPERIFTLNSAVRPQIPIRAGERQLWRIVNASPDRYADLELDGQRLEVIALDGMPLTYHNRSRQPLKLDHFLLAPGARIEAIVTGPPEGANSRLSTRCVDTGPDGDLNPAMVIADLVDDPHQDRAPRKIPATTGAPTYKEFAARRLERLEASPADFTVVFTEDKNGFYINGKKFSMDAAPMLEVRIGSLHHWRVVNDSHEIHPFHIHQVHFLAYAVNGVREETSEWLDTVNVPYGGTVDLIMDFTDPVIRGVSVFHCHLLSHEDKGMMAKIRFE